MSLLYKLALSVQMLVFCQTPADTTGLGGLQTVHSTLRQNEITHKNTLFVFFAVKTLMFNNLKEKKVKIEFIACIPRTLFLVCMLEIFSKGNFLEWS